MTEPVSDPMSPRTAPAEVAAGVVIGRVPGHVLKNGGAAFNADGTPVEPPGGYRYVGGPGHGLCSCGVLSDELATSYARRKWHWQHKQEVIDAV